jgi:ribonuclease VapC
MFIDASAMIAILASEPERDVLQDKIDQEVNLLTSPLAIYESTLGLARLSGDNFTTAEYLIQSFVADMPVKIVSIDVTVAALALQAFKTFGKGSHRAKLNMGDCFSYACAKIHRVPLLFKGDDFIHTDIQQA